MIVRVRMNHPDGKRLLAALRDGDFAHAGEEAAVRMAWECLPKRANQSCLDAGCGRGGTAALVQAERWGQVIGLDIDSETISFAQSAYSNVRFVAADVTCAGGLFPAQFDIIYAFNAFYAFPDQQAALSALRRAAKSEAILCLFDYLDQGGFNQTRFAGKPETLLWRPRLDEIVAVRARSDRMAFTRVERYWRGLRDLVQRVGKQVRCAAPRAPRALRLRTRCLCRGLLLLPSRGD